MIICRINEGMYKKKYYVCTLLLGLFTCFFAKASDYGLSEVEDGFYVHHGQHVNFDDPNYDDIANIGFIIGDKCIAVIDTGGSIKAGSKLYNAIKNISDKPICYVINTHVHIDHISGNHIFRNNNAKFIGHENLEDEVLSSSALFLERLNKDMESITIKDIIIPPDITVKDMLTIDLGNRELIIKAYPAAHSYTDLSVFDKKTNTLWLSDLLFIERIPALDGSLIGWLEVLKSLDPNDKMRIIPGHGSSELEWNEAFEPQIEYLTMLLNDTRLMIKQGAFMEEALDKVAKEEKLKWILHEQHHKKNVIKAFTELEWE